MMTELRKKMSIFIWVVVAGFILFIFLQWGMNISGRKRQPEQISVVAKVEGVSIKTQDYYEKSSTMLNNIRDMQNLTSMDPLTERLVFENAFEEMVRRVIIQKQLRKNGITLTKSEIMEILKNSPPSIVLEDSSMYTNGKFDPQKYISVLLNPANRYFLYEQTQRITESYPLAKLNAMISAGIKVTQPEVLKFYQEESTKVKVSFIPFRIEDYLNAVAISDEDINNYYTVHKEEFSESAGARLKTITFETNPSLTDEMEAERDVEDIYSLFEEGLDFDTLVLTYSQDANTNQEGGDLGFVKRGDLEPEMEEVAFSLRKGEVSTPFKTSLGWHILKVTDLKGKERRISHLLIQINPGFETISEIRTTIDSVKSYIKNFDIETARERYGTEYTDITLYKKQGDLLPEIGRIIGVSEYLFSGVVKENDVIGPFIGYDGNYHIFQVVSFFDESIKELDEVREEVEDKVRREKAMEIAQEEAKQCFELIRNGLSIKEAASLSKKELHTTGFFSMKDFIPAVPYSSEFYGLAFTLSEGETGLASAKKGSFIVRLLDRREANKDNFQTESANIFMNLIMNKRQAMVAHWFQTLRDSANIKDNRYQLNIY
jgi:peptidyl-prolyl cis-trans isomerase D